MPFITPLKLQLLNEESIFPWITLAPLVYEHPETGVEYTVPVNFRTDGPSVPIGIAAIPVAGQAMILRLFATGIFKAFKPGVLHDWARRKRDGVRPMPAAQAHALLRDAMRDCGYEEDIVQAYYSAVVAFNSSDD